MTSQCIYDVISLLALLCSDVRDEGQAFMNGFMNGKTRMTRLELKISQSNCRKVSQVILTVWSISIYYETAYAFPYG